MNKNNLEKSQFISSSLTSLLLYVFAIWRIINKKPFWYLVLIVAFVMTASAYNSYRKMKEKQN